MRDPNDNDTHDLWGVDPQPPAALLRRKPRCRVVGTCIILVDHPHLPPIGYMELARHNGRMVSVLREREAMHVGQAQHLRNRSTPELKARPSPEEMRASVLAMRYHDAIEDFARRR